jgi:hypothetical protein
MPTALCLLAVLPIAVVARGADAPERIVFGPLPSDAKQEATPTPPADPFEAAGFTVKESSWDSRPLKISRFACSWPGLHNPWVQAFRERYGFLKHIEKGVTETEKLLLLRQWVYQTVKFARGDPRELDPFVILDAPDKGWVCTQYAIAMQACAVACGWVAWNTHIECDHTAEEKSTSHAVTEIWINEMGKWVVFDAMKDAHHEKAGVMLSAAEVGREWVADQGAHVEVYKGVERQKVAGVRRGVLGGRNDAAGYFWNKHVWTWDPFRTFGSQEPDMQVSLIWDAHEGKQWYQGAPPNTSVVNALTRGALIFTRREADVYPDIGICSLNIRAGQQAGSVQVAVATFTPGLEAVLISTDGGAWAPAHEGADEVMKQGRRLRFDWPLHEGENKLSVRTRNEFGILGKATNVRVVLAKKPQGD